MADTKRMQAGDVTPEWLQSLSYTLVPSSKPTTIDGVYVKDLKTHLDGRGDVIELWSKSWVEKEGLVVPEHVYQSATDYGVTKCWHLHNVHTDQFTVTRGKLQVVLVDIRPWSPTFGQVNSVILGTARPKLIKIPPMVMHGWKALHMPEVIVVNLQSHIYDPVDEFKFEWDCVLKEAWEPLNG